MQRLAPTPTHSFLSFHPELLSEIDAGTIDTMDFDVLDVNVISKRFDYIRCMNLLNQSYFSDEDIRLGIKTLHKAINPGGILQLGRTSLEFENSVGFYRRTERDFELIDVFGEGSEIDYLIRPRHSDTSAPAA